MKIHILGTGCSKCKSLMANATTALRELGLEAELEKIEEIEEMIKFGVTSMPALVLDGKVLSAGRVPTVEQIKGFLGSPAPSDARPGPSGRARITALLCLIVAVALVVYAKGRTVAAPASPSLVATSAEVTLPTMVEVGSETCIPCRAMVPVLAELRRDYAGKLRVVFINFEKETAAAEKYGVKMIPTQIFLDQDGKELFRHEGFYAKVEIDAKLQELKVLR